MNAEAADVFRKHKHHLDTTCFYNLTAGKRMRRVLPLHCHIVHFEAVATLNLEKPFPWFGIEVDNRSLAGEDLTGAEIDVDIILVIGFICRNMGLGVSPNVDAERGDIVRPILSSYLGICLDIFRLGFMDGVGMIRARLDGGAVQTLDDLGKQTRIIATVSRVGGLVNCKQT